MSYQVKHIDQIINQELKIGRKDAATTLTSSEQELKVDKQLNVSGNKVVNVAAPTEDTDAANKQYVDSKVGTIKTTIEVKDDGVTKGDVNAIDVIDTDSLVKGVVAVEDGVAKVTLSHGVPEGGTATTNTGATVISNLTKTDDGHITAINTTEITPAVIGAQPEADALTSLAAATAGIIAKIDDNTVASREIKGGNGVTVTNGNGVSGDPTITVGDASVTEKGIVQLSDATNSDSSATAATSKAVKAVEEAKVNKAGDTMTGFLTLHAEPTQQMHAANKGYVDAVAQGLNIHEAVRVATTGAITLSGLQTVDGITLVDGDRVLVKDQDNSAEDGVYVVASGSWTRADDCNEADELTSFYVFVLEGNTYGGFGFNQTTKVGTVGTTEQTWEIFNKPAEFSVVEGAGVTVTQSGRKYTVAAKDASVSQAGIVQLVSDPDSDSTTMAPTASALKTVKDALDTLNSNALTKVTSGTAGHVATLDAEGRVVDGGVAVLSGAIADNKADTSLVGAKQVVDYVAAAMNENVSGSEVKTLKFTLGTDATTTSTTSLPADAVILSTKLVVSTAYTENTTIGITAGGSNIMSTTDNDPAIVGHFEGESDVVTASAGAVTVTIGGAPTAGAGYVVVTYAEEALA